MFTESAVTTDRRSESLARATGVAGLVGVVLVFVPIIAISSLGEPPLDAKAGEIVTFFRDADVAWFQAAQATGAIGMLALLWFFVGFTTLLRRVEGEAAWRSMAAVLSSVLLVAYGNIDVSWNAAISRGAETDPGVAVYAFDWGNLGFTNAWLAMASFAVATGWVLLETRALQAWWGWLAIACGAGLVAARFVWETWFWTLPYGLFWFWLIALAVRLIRRRHLVPGPELVTERTDG